MCPGDSLPADFACFPSVSFVDGTTPSSPRADHTDLAPTDKASEDLHVDALPPAEPPPDILPLTANNPPGFVIHHLFQDQDRSPSPTNPFNFPFSLHSNAIEQSSLAELPTPPSVSDSVIRVVGCPRVLGLQQDSQSSVIVCQSDKPSLLIDGGVNICVTGNLSILVGVVDIPPLPIMVAIKDKESSIDDCCTK